MVEDVTFRPSDVVRESLVQDSHLPGEFEDLLLHD
jgi:hypothetical protein